eukprot:TRINITY_DN913_c0_g1_i1.p1 TRINITY_DN913_c0_g1~~TRINITY_DN913_c0_g1_i1.p1  ORF type:complete len:748 (+),score=47.98 TRINITY_DN913_c0_g1_i1:315-2246(+)
MNGKLNKPKKRKIKTRADFEIKGITIKRAKATVLSKQQKIADAIRKGDNTKARKLTRSLLRSRTARAIALHTILTNKGYRSKGYADKKPTTAEDYAQIMLKMWRIIKGTRHYSAKPLRRIHIPKPKGGLRPLSVPTYFDRSLQALFKMPLDAYQEEKADKFSFGFRPFRSPAWAAKAAWLHMNNKHSRGPPPYVIEMDLKKCFDTIDHNWLLNNIPFIPTHILKEWLKCGFVLASESYQKLHATTGTPQGSPISPTLCNITLDGMEEAINQKLNNKFGKKDRQNWSRVVRFADDAVIFVYSLKAANEALNALQEFLTPRGLEMNQEKTKITNWTNESFNFVGFRFLSREVNGKRRKYYDIPPQKIKGLFEKIKLINRRIHRTSQLFIKINPIIRGFCQFYGFSNSSSQMQQIRIRIFWLMWNKLRRIYKQQNTRVRKTLNLNNKTKIKHKHITSAIIKNHYFEVRGKTGRKIKWLSVKKTKDTPRGCKLFNPGDIECGLGSTLSGKSAFNLEHIPKLSSVALKYKTGFTKKVYKKTKGQCSICQNSVFFFNDGFELHHKRPYAFGGRLTLDNIIPLCKECHKEVTKAVASRDIDKIVEYINIDVLDEIVIKQELIPNQIAGPSPQGQVSHVSSRVLGNSYARL